MERPTDPNAVWVCRFVGLARCTETTEFLGLMATSGHASCGWYAPVPAALDRGDDLEERPEWNALERAIQAENEGASSDVVSAAAARRLWLAVERRAARGDDRYETLRAAVSADDVKAIGPNLRSAADHLRANGLPHLADSVESAMFMLTDLLAALAASPQPEPAPGEWEALPADDLTWRCTACDSEFDTDDLEQVQPDGHYACPACTDADPKLEARPERPADFDPIAVVRLAASPATSGDGA